VTVSYSRRRSRSSSTGASRRHRRASRTSESRDTIDLYSHFNIGRPHHERFSNPVAAVPSLHAGWALGVGAGLLLYARTAVAKLVGFAYPLAVLVTLVVTGNHFFFDTIAGALVMALGFAATAPFRARAAQPAYAADV
jgi:membrane-associated phospholipid phosphatase